MRNALTLALALGCILCGVSIARTLERTYRQGYVGSAVMFARVACESGPLLFTADEPIRPVRLSDLTTVKGGAR